MRLFLTLVLVVAVTAACSAERPCTLIGSPAGVGVDIEPAMAAKTIGGTLTLCWADTCRDGRFDLVPSTTAVPRTCDGGNCAAEMLVTGGSHAFMNVPDLPATEMKATVRLTDESGTTVVDQTVDITTTATYPNGPHCDSGGPQEQLLVDADGAVRVR
jgi:hypothetical protein